MKQNIELYIDNKRVDFSNELTLPFTYHLKDVNNPTIVKNPFTKTIEITGTPNNNKIFGEIYNLDREQLYGNNIIGSYFNPSMRTPFSIFKNNEIIESGYMQLNTITVENKNIKYNITLYGGIGNFFYNLMYNDNNEPLTLSNLIYEVKDSNGNVINSDDELSFNISKEFVRDCFNKVGKDNNGTIYDYLTFIPAYNGLPNNFDSNKVLVNVDDLDIVRQTTVDNKTYRTYNNYLLATLPKKLTEWEIKDLRSYLQRPAIRMKSIINACQNPINNGGYVVELDDTFFNNDNPYYNDSWVALPLLTSLEKEKNNIKSSTLEQEKDLMFGINYNKTLTPLLPTDNFVINGEYVDYSNTPLGTLTDVEIEYSIRFSTTETDTTKLTEELYNTSSFFDENTDNRYITASAPINVQLNIVDNNDKLISFSDIYSYSNDKRILPIYPSSSLFPNLVKTTQVQGYFKKIIYNGITTVYDFVDNNGNATFKIKLSNIPYNQLFQIQLEGKQIVDDYYFPLGRLYNSTNKMVNGNFEIVLNSAIIRRDEPDTTISTNSLVTKEKLLKTEKTPADYLLSFCKMFNLYFTINEADKKIKIQTMNNYFSGEIIDISNKIDISKAMTINPIVYDSKFYCIKLEGENYYLKKYKNQYTVEYGQKRINTNYNFNTNTKQLFENNVFQNTVSVIDTSTYYHTFFNANNDILAPIQFTNFDYELYNTTDGKLNKTTLKYSTPVVVGGASWNFNSGYDAFAKTCFYNIENDEKTLSDISSTLLIYNGNLTPQDTKGTYINYYLSDDVSDMFELNEKVACYLFDSNNTITVHSIPQYLRYKIVGNNVVSSLDFGLPKELYIPNITYNDNTTLYNQFWSGYYEDSLNINTKQVTCYVNLNDMLVNGDLLKKFYYFNGCYWLLNKIENYNCNSYDTTKCTFIKINNITNYKGV